MPERISFSEHGYFADEHGWTLAVNMEGHAILQVHSHEHGPVHLLIGNRMEQLRLTLNEIDVFSLPSRVGTPIVDGGEQRITVEHNGRRHEISIYPLDPLAVRTNGELQVLQLWKTVYTLVDKDELDRCDDDTAGNKNE